MEYLSWVYSNTPEDSGLGESSRNESNSNSLYTPTTSFPTSRKRKNTDQQSMSANLKQTPSVDSIESSPWTKNPDILSSTFNDSITASVEKCNLKDNYNCSYYVETLKNNLKDIKEPSTPEKSSLNKRYYTSPRVSPMLKLGSPERNDILYSNRSNVARLSESKRCSPAKKNLFPSNIRKDPVVFFSKVHSCSHIIYNVFKSLQDDDLYTCSKVSGVWKQEILNNEILRKRLYTFSLNRIMNKENYCEYPLANVSSQIKQSTPMQSLPRMNEITNSLTKSQHIEKCLFCGKPIAIVEGNISQCPSPQCGGIRCLNCNSISKTGPADFVNKCEQSALLLDKPPSRHSLLDSPKQYQNNEGIPSFLLNDSLNTSQTFNSSGYLTDGETTQNSSFRNSPLTTKDKERADMSQALKNCNMRVVSRSNKDWEVRNRILPVISVTRRREEIIEPSSPPKVKHIAGSKKSKKILKRLAQR